ncbi:hypothetical protein [Streptomyces sp. NPDC059874]|uniref:hypothetical protein n=1 Tax=Streptomyces sp. NPDC059874 TaxID=3346983 RepID=UPI0036571F26
MVNWRRRHTDFPALSAGTEVHPEFERSAVVAWLVANDKIEVLVGAAAATLLVRCAGGGRRFRLDAPWLGFTDDVEDPDRLSGWSSDEDADAWPPLAAGEFGASLTRLAAPGAGPLGVLGEVRMTERFLRAARGGLDAGCFRGRSLRRSAGGLRVSRRTCFTRSRPVPQTVPPSLTAPATQRPPQHQRGEAHDLHSSGPGNDLPGADAFEQKATGGLPAGRFAVR